MKQHHTTATPSPRAWRIVRHYHSGTHESTTVEPIQAYELALLAFKRGLAVIGTPNASAGFISIELRDPSGRALLDSRHITSNLEPDDDGLLDAPGGHYVWTYDDGTGHDAAGRFKPARATQ